MASSSALPQIVTPLRATYHSVQTRERSPRKKRKYKDAEIEVIEKYKGEYRKATSREDRQQLLQNYILVEIFNYWYTKGEVTEDISEEDLSEHIKNLSIWIRNNWRPVYKRSGLFPNERKKSRVDVVWQNMKEKVMVEIKAMFSEQGESGESGEPSQDFIFKNRTTAAKRVFLALSPDEQSSIMDMIDKGVDMVPVDVKQRRALKLGSEAVKRASKKLWTDMGIYTLTFFGYVKPNGKITLETYDNMAGLSGNTIRKFFVLYENEVDVIQRRMVEYIKLLQPSAIEQSKKARPDLIISTKDGFPWMPPVVEDIDQKKEELEKLLRTYLNEHYKLASGKRRNHVPINKLITDGHAMVDKIYVPTSFQWKDPRNMTKDAICDLCNHIRKRQEDHGPSNAFRFKMYFDGKEFHNAEYGTARKESVAAARARKQRDDRKAKSAENQKKKKRKLFPQVTVRQGNQDAEQVTQGHSQQESQHTPREETMRQRQATQGEPQQENPFAPQEGTILAPGEGPVSGVIDPSLCGVSIENQIRGRYSDQAGVDHSRSLGGYIDDVSMRRLKENGYSHEMVPVNGPQDGPPRYYVPAAALNILSRLDNPITEGDQQDNDIIKEKAAKKKKKVRPKSDSLRRSGRVQKDKGKEKIDNTKIQTRSQKRGKISSNKR